MVNKKNLPKISVVIPSFQKGDFIESTLQSIFSQGYSNFEVIVQDGGSTDQTVEILKKYRKMYPKKLHWVSKKDKGQVDAINTGLKKASGEIVTYLNADDVYKKDTFEKVSEAYQKNSDCFWMVGGGDIIDEKGNSFSSWVSLYKNVLMKINKYKLLLMVNYISQPSTFLTQKAYVKYGPFTGTKKYVLEYDLWLKLGKDQMPVVISEILSSFRLIKGTISATSFKVLLRQDHEIAEKYTRNPILLFLHGLHNWARVALINLVLK